jgi:hypothetical protein
MARTKSKYAEKRDGGNQMYGPGCCAHKVTDAQVAAGKERARARGHFDAPPRPSRDADILPN